MQKNDLFIIFDLIQYSKEMHSLNYLDSNDWDRIFILSVKHSIAPYLYKVLKDNKSIPQEIKEKFKNQFLLNSIKNIRTFYQLKIYLEEFNKNNIKGIVLKGGYLAENVYQRIGLRIMSDIDIFFPEKNLTEAQNIISDIRNSLAVPCFSIDVHWNIDLSIADLNIKADEFINRSVKVKISDIEFNALSPEDLLIHACTHIAFHHQFRFGVLKTFCDIKEICRHFRNEIDWNFVIIRSKKWKVTNTIYLVLSVVQKYINADIPESFLIEIKPIDNLVESEDWLIGQITNLEVAASDISISFWYLFSDNSIKEKMKNIKRMIFPDKKVILQKFKTRYSKKKFSLYLKRMLRYSPIYLKYMLKIILREKETMDEKNRNLKNIEMQNWLNSK